MANYFLNDDGSLTTKKKKNKGVNYILQGDGTLKPNKQEEIAPTISDLRKRQDELRKQLNNIDREEKVKWWDEDKNILQNAGNVLYKAFLEPQNSKYKEDKNYTKLLNEYNQLNKDIENSKVENTKYSDGFMGFVEKSNDVVLGNAMTANKGITTTAKKILGQEITKEDYQQHYYEKLGNTATQNSSGVEKVILDVEGSITRMIPQLALNPAGATIMGFANYGGGAYNQARQEGYDDEKATLYGSIIGGSEILLGKLLGTFEDVSGAGGLSNKIMSKLIKNEAIKRYVSGAIGEFSEEYLQEFLEPIIRNTVLEEENGADFWNTMKDDVGEGLKQLGHQLFNAENLKAGAMGALTSGIAGAPSAIDNYKYTKKTGRSLETGLTSNEQQVLDKEIERRVEEAKQENPNLSKKEIAKIEEDARKSLERGEISTDTIESVLGGDRYNTYKANLDRTNSINAEIEELGKQTFTPDQAKEYNDAQARLKGLREELSKIDTNASREQLDFEMGQKLAKDNILHRSYEEKAKKGQTYQADLSKYDAKQQKVIQNAIDSGILNNTRKTHEFVDMVAKLSADKGIDFNFANNQKLKESGFAVEGKSIDGFVNKSGITLNIDSTKALNKVVGHEITHVLEGTELYNELQTAIKEYATTKGIWDTRLAEISERYKNVEDANVENELTSDLVGEYLFTDTDFVNNLSTTKPNVFEKIYDEIKYLLKVATSGSKEARELEKVKKTFGNAYKNASKTSEYNTQYSLNEDSEEINVSIKGEQKTFNNYYDFAKEITKNNDELTKELLFKSYNFKFSVPTDTNETSFYHGTDAVYDYDALRTMDYDSQTMDRNYGDYFYITTDKNFAHTYGNQIAQFIIPNNKIMSLEDYGKSDKSENELFKDYWAIEMPDNEYIVNDIKPIIEYSKQKVQDYINSKSNTQYSLTDNQGRTLTEEQQEYFKDSKVRDKEGNIEVVYHSTPNQFTVFNNNMLGENTGYDNTIFGTFVTTNKAFSERFKDIENTGTKGYTMELYANVTNPITHPYNAHKKYELAEASKIVEDYYKALGETEALEEMREIVSDGDADSLYHAYMDIAITNDIFEYAKEEREKLEKAGYDAVEIIEGYESELVEGSKSDGVVSSYAIFNSNQLKNVDNTNPTDDPDIRHSLSNENEIAPTRKNNSIYGEDVRLEQAIAPLEQTIENLSNQIEELSNKIERQAITTPVTAEDLPFIEQQLAENSKYLNEDDIAPTTEGGFANYDEVEIKGKREIVDELRGYFGIKQYEARELYDTIANKDVVTIDDVVEELENYRNVKYEEVDNDLKDLKKALKSIRINASTIKNQITDYNDFRKSNMGRLTLANDGQAIDTVYQELSNMYPQYFPSDITTEADQLERIADVANEDINSTQVYELNDDALYELAQKLYSDIGNRERFLGSEEQRKEFKRNAKTMEAPELSEIEKLDEEIATQRAIIEKIERTNPNSGSLSFDYHQLNQLVEQRNKLTASNTQETANIAPIRSEMAQGNTNTLSSQNNARNSIRNDLDIARQEAARVLEERPTPKNKEKKLAATAVINLVDKGYYISKLARQTNNRQLDALWDNTLLSNAQAQEIVGEGRYRFNEETRAYDKVGESVYEIYEGLENTNKKQQFDEYMYHRLNVERMSLAEKGEKNKPVFGNNVSAAQSQMIVNELEQNNPEFIDYAKRIYEYESGTYSDLSLLVESGILSQESANYYKDKYKNYVPIIRDIEANTLEHKVFGKRASVGNVVKQATGGNQNIIPLKDAMAIKTMLVQRSANMNRLGLELMHTLNPVVTEEAVTAEQIIDDISNSKDLIQAGTNGKAATMTVYEHGTKMTFEIPDEIYQALKANYDSNLNITIKPLNAFSNFKRGVLTQYNPFFMVTNAIKDSQDILINSQHPISTYKAIPEAIAQLSKKGYWYKEMQAQGLFQDTYYDNQQGFNVKKSKIENFYPLRKISEVNDFIERVPRMAEYIASRKAGASVEVASLDASRVTTNFKAGGDFTKFLNRNGVTFLNASIQGAAQQVRNFQEAQQQGLKGYMKLATKFAIAALPAVLLNNLLWDDDEEYEELSDYIKDNYYIVGKYGDGQFIRIPKGRMTAVIQDGLEQMTNLATGDDEVDLNNFLELVLTNLAPSNPLENNILSPFINTKLFNKDDPGKTWYGEDLVPTRLQDKPVAEQYDEGTSELSKWLGEKLNLSPIKIDNLIDQNTGVIGDLLLPTMTAEAKTKNSNPIMAAIEDKFTADAVFDNKNSSDFYETKNKLTVAANGSKATDEDVLKNKYMNSVQSDMNDIYAKIREVQNSNLDKKTKYAEVKRLREELNAMAENALNTYDDIETSSNYSKVGDKEFYKNSKDEWTSIKSEEVDALNNLNMTSTDKNNYFKTKNLISNIVKEYKGTKDGLDDENEDSYKSEVSALSGEKKANIINTIKNSGLDDESMAYLYDKYYASPEKLNTVIKTGIGMNAYLDLEAQNFQSDKNAKGETISGSKKAKVFEYINSTNIGFEQKVILAKMYYPSYDEYNYDIINYLNNDNSISYNDMVDILKTLGFKVYDNGTIEWD